MTVPMLQPGQAYRTKASHHNAMARAANAYTAGELGGGVAAASSQYNPGVGQIKNTSGEDCDAGDVLAISGVEVTPEDLAVDANAMRWMTDPVMLGVKPDLTSPVGNNQHVGKFAVLLEPIPDGTTGMAVFNGIANCPIDIDHADHVFADVAHDTFRLTSNFYGAAEILYKFEWPASSGTWYARVKLGLFQSPLIDGVAQESIAADTSGDVQVLWNDTASQTITAWNDHMHSGNAIANGADVMLYFSRDRGRWSIKEVGCA